MYIQYPYTQYTGKPISKENILNSVAAQSALRPLAKHMNTESHGWFVTARIVHTFGLHLHVARRLIKQCSHTSTICGHIYGIWCMRHKTNNQ